MSQNDSQFGKVAVLLGGQSAEREVSLISGRGVLQALHSRGIDAHAFDPSERELGELKRQHFTRCFIALHGRFGEDGTVQGALELMGIPYTGSGVMASSIAIDKVMTKRVWLAEGLPTPKYILLRRGAFDRKQVVAVPDELGLPVIVKPAREGSSIGVVKVAGYSGMTDAVDQAAQLDADVLCEQFIEGDEVTCPVLGSGDGARPAGDPYCRAGGQLRLPEQVFHRRHPVRGALRTAGRRGRSHSGDRAESLPCAQL